MRTKIISEEDILQIIKSKESLTFPNGVGSTFRCVKNNSYDELAKDINELISRKFFNVRRGK